MTNKESDLRHDNINNNNPISTPTDAAQHMAENKLFCKLEFS